MDQVALELGQRREDAEHQPAGGGRGVDVAGQHLQPDAALVQIADEADDVGQRAAEPVEMGYSGFRPLRHSRSGRVKAQGCDGPSRVGGDS